MSRHRIHNVAAVSIRMSRAASEVAAAANARCCRCYRCCRGRSGIVARQISGECRHNQSEAAPGKAGIRVCIRHELLKWCEARKVNVAARSAALRAGFKCVWCACAEPLHRWQTCG